MAGLGHFKVISVDYRMAPDHPYPAALDDVTAVWHSLSTTTAPKNMAIFGASAGGNLTLAAVLKAKEENLPLPGAIGPATPMSDLTNAGDTFQHERFPRQCACCTRRRLRQTRRALHRWSGRQGPATLASVWRYAWLSTGNPHDRYARSSAEQHGARPPQTPPSRCRGDTSGLRGSVTRSVPI